MPSDRGDRGPGSGPIRGGRGYHPGPGRRGAPQRGEIEPISPRAAQRAREQRERAEREANQSFMSRRVFIGLVFAAGTLAATGKLLDYQVFNRERYVTEADYRRVDKQTLFALRGTIYDRNGNILASSEECSNVYVNPQLVTNVNKAVSALVSVLGVDEKACRKLVADTSTSFNYIQRKVDQEDADKLSKMGIAGIEFEPTVKRVYPNQSLASQVLGAINDENKGLLGLELYYEDILQGENGSIQRERARDGSYIAGGAYTKVPAKNGTDIMTSLDITIQKAAEEAIAKAVEDTGAKYGSAVAIDPITGEIFAACSYPTFDQENLAEAKSENLNLRIVTDAYEPGSVFKTFVVGGALEDGVITTDTVFNVPAVVKAGDDNVRDSDQRGAAMDMDAREILRRSSNTGMVLIGKKMGAKKFAANIKRFCFGTITGVDFPGETKGLVKSLDEYDGASVGAMSFGQSLAVTPVQVLRAASGLANGGVMSVPHFLTAKHGEEVDWSSKQKTCIEAAHADEVVSMMETVVESGTGTGAQIPGYRIAGKTGTAERAGDAGYEAGNNMASFLGFTSPENPRAMVYITLDGTAATSHLALEPFKTVMQSCIDVLGIQTDA